jgi:hypothetical protein
MATEKEEDEPPGEAVTSTAMSCQFAFLHEFKDSVSRFFPIVFFI